MSLDFKIHSILCSTAVLVPGKKLPVIQYALLIYSNKHIDDERLEGQSADMCSQCVLHTFQFVFHAHVPDVCDRHVFLMSYRHVPSIDLCL